MSTYLCKFAAPEALEMCIRILSWQRSFVASANSLKVLVCTAKNSRHKDLDYTELYCGIILRNCIPELQCGNILRNYITEFYYIIILRNHMTTVCYGSILQNYMMEIYYGSHITTVMVYIYIYEGIYILRKVY